MSRYLLDTNICVHYLKAEHDLENKVLAVGLHDCFISELTIAEMLYGLAKCDHTYAVQQRQHIGSYAACSIPVCCQFLMPSICTARKR